MLQTNPVTHAFPLLLTSIQIIRQVRFFLLSSLKKEKNTEWLLTFCRSVYITN
jgi:hypothetical protein